VTLPGNPPPYTPAPCLEQDEPGHSQFRLPMQPWFSPGSVGNLEGDVRALMTELIDVVIDDGRCNAATSIAEPVPPIMIANILGIPKDRWSWFREQSELWLHLVQVGENSKAGDVLSAFHVYFAQELERRRSEPWDNMFTRIVRMTVDGRPITVDEAPITVDEAVSLAFLIMIAGHETTTGAIAGMLYQVAKNPDVRDRLLADPSLRSSCVEEALRMETSLMGLARLVTHDIDIGGFTLMKGDRVMLMWGSANRDEAVFEGAESFRVDRTHNRHVAFGSGIHRCIGAHLARLEMRVVLDKVLYRMPSIRLDVEESVSVRWETTRSFINLPIAW
jgi:cytochrome P450